MVRVAINGYGRIGRTAHKIILEKHSSELEVVGINAGDSTDIKGWANLFRYDSNYGPLNPEIRVQTTEISEGEKGSFLKDSIGHFVINEQKIPVFSQKDPSLLPWRDLNTDVVIEATGDCLTEEKAKAHLAAGAKTVVLAAPEKGGNIPTYIISVNDKNYNGEKIISNSSCTTNCIAPIVKIISQNFGIEKAMMTTIHAYTSDQRLQDGGHKDYRRARSAAQNIVPTSTGAANSAAKVIPELSQIFSGMAIRVPVAVGSLSDFTFVIKKNTTVEEVNALFKKEAEGKTFRGIVSVTEDPIVSSDIIGNPSSSIVDLSLTQIVGGNMLKVVAWYDNEYGYANRLVEEVILIGNKTASI